MTFTIAVEFFSQTLQSIFLVVFGTITHQPIQATTKKNLCNSANYNLGANMDYSLKNFVINIVNKNSIIFMVTCLLLTSKYALAKHSAVIPIVA